jgi:hypothetical protein
LDHLDWLDKGDRLELQDILEPLDQLAREDLKANLDSLDHKDHWDLLVILVTLGRRVHWEMQDKQVLKAPLDHKVQLGLQETLATEAMMDNLA